MKVFFWRVLVVAIPVAGFALGMWATRAVATELLPNATRRTPAGTADAVLGKAA